MRRSRVRSPSPPPIDSTTCACIARPGRSAPGRAGFRDSFHIFTIACPTELDPPAAGATIRGHEGISGEVVTALERSHPQRQSRDSRWSRVDLARMQALLGLHDLPERVARLT